MKIADLVQIESLASEVIDAGYRLHRDLGPGLLESVYEILLAEVLKERGIRSERQLPLPLRYGRVAIENAFKIDLMVEGCLIVELKSSEQTLPVHGKQLLTYLRIANLPLGLLMNFGQVTFKAGLRRIANDYYGNIPKR